MNKTYDMYSEFNLEKHLETFVDYFEAIILPDGKIEYAIPSHQEKLIALAMKKRDMSREEYLNSVPEEYYANFLYYLLLDTGCISVWSCGYAAAENITEKQKEVLKVLILIGIKRKSGILYNDSGKHDYNSRFR